MYVWMDGYMGEGGRDEIPEGRTLSSILFVPFINNVPKFDDDDDDDDDDNTKLFLEGIFRGQPT